MPSRIAALSIAVLCAILVGWATTLAGTSQNLGIAGALAFLLVTLVGAHLLVARRSGDTLNLLSVAGVFYLLMFFCGGVYVWLSLPGGPGSPIFVTISTAGLARAISLVAVSWVCFAAGYIIDPLRVARVIWRPPNRIALAVRLVPLLASLLGLGWAARLVLLAEGNYYHIHTAAPSPSAISWFTHTMSLLPLVALAVLSIHAFAPDGAADQHRMRRWLAALLISEFAWAIPTGSREAIVTVLLVVIVVRYYVLHRIPPLKTVIPIMCIFVFIVFPLVATYRSGDFRASPVTAFVTSFEGERHRTGAQRIAAAEQTLARIADVTAPARILELGRNRMRFSTGDTVRDSLEGFVPRALFPQKANASALDNEFGRSYGFLAPNDFITSIAVTQPGELYLGGGWVGVGLGMLILGGLLRTLDEYLRARRSDRGVLALYAVTVPIVLVGFESSIAIGFVGAVKATVLLGLVLVALGWTLSREGFEGRSQIWSGSA